MQHPLPVSWTTEFFAYVQTGRVGAIMGQSCRNEDSAIKKMIHDDIEL